MATFLNTIIDFATTAGIRLLIAAAVVIIGWILVNKLLKLLQKTEKIKKLDVTVVKFLLNFANFALKFFLLIIAASILGVDMSSVVALVAALGVTIGLALQGGLSNIAGGIIILLFKPFKIGDYVDAGGVAGTVTDINMFYTVLRSIDNKTLYVPNSAASNGTITNFSEEQLRRVDLEFSVEYGTNIDGVKALLLDIAKKNKFAIDTPEPTVQVSALTDKEIKILYRVWCDSANYWDTYFSLNEAVKNGFEKFNVHIPYRQVTVHYEKEED